MRAAVVINAAAGSLIGRAELAEEVAERLGAAGLDAEVVPDSAGDLIERLDRATALGAEAVVVGGGDGTIAAAAQRLVGTETALGILPLGTMNMLAKDLKIPLDIPAAVEALAHGATRSIDVGEVNGHVFLCASMLGLPARLAHHREQTRHESGPGKWWRLATAAFEATRRYPPLTFAVRLGNGARRIRSRFVAIADNAFDEGIGQILTRSRLDGGELVLYYARAGTPWDYVKLAANVALGTWQSYGMVESHHVTRLDITSRRRLIRVMNDGEVILMRPPLHYRIRPQALKVIVPAEALGKVEAEPGDQAIAEPVPAGALAAGAA